MGEALILVGGVTWIVVMLTMVGYSSVLAGSRQTVPAVFGFMSSAALFAAGIWCVDNARLWAEGWWG